MENNFKHTKGEWFFEEKINSEGNISINMFSSKGGLLTKLIDDDSKTFEEIKANALLMKKAPELLFALKEMVSFCQFHGYTHSTEINNSIKLIEEISK